MAEKKSVVTPKRFASGFGFKDYIAQIKVNKDKFEEYYQTAQLSDEDKGFFRKIAGMPNGAVKVLVLGEDWCPDVFRGMPVIARIAEASGMEMRIFPRDQNLDIMNEFLN
ncbi:MAG: thioredoxin family protein, partial [Chloroflexi bacterium]|nr:thioredoxin family protein [Chloroflexota bacterium]